MDDVQVIHFLTRALEVSASESNWANVLKVDQQIASLLSALAGKPLSNTQREALRTLKQVHQEVNEHCRRQSEILEREMMLRRRNQEGALAYAVFMNDEDIG
ncbi:MULTISPECIES: hypothetical protein [unclassified Serratia (in: enterobacteria)]|uniref:hypothetical protein n=1 Tax=unclassified Serratia (in: enterobacteria) TaxID=2647522 RepID=UPI000505E920|nr:MULTISPECIES: hypothetical protein [unclassified Serratia (in: enterobacteria)]KFK95334.1 hypothetical protein JV45_08210 [Serratia sp. Ag2]KFK98682.1 hypothetical protein IV04_10915 [Serratia sp. Ag1]